MASNLRSFLAVSLLLVPCVALSQKYRYSNFNTEDGLPQDYVYSICQDSLGFLWVGTAEGLASYNGLEMKKHTTSDSLASNFIMCSLQSGKEMWFGHENGTVSCYDGRNFRKVILSKKVSDRITALSLSPTGEIWAATSFSGLFRLNRKKMVFDEVLSDDFDITAICHLTPNKFLAGTNSGLKIFSIDYLGRVFSVSEISGVPPSRIASVKKANNGDRFLIATENEGIYIIRNVGDNLNIEKVAGSEELTGVQDLCEGNDSELWVATYGDGLAKISCDPSSGNILHLNAANGFISDNVRTVFRDREGNIWSGNFGNGLTLVTPETFSFFNPDPGRYGSSVFSILADGGIKWIGTGKGLLKVESSTGRVLYFFTATNGLARDTVTSLYKDTDGILWIGTGRNGVFRMSPKTGKIMRCAMTPEGLGSSVTALTGKGNLVYAGSRKGLCIYEQSSGKISHLSISSGLPHNWINCIYPGDSGKVWISTKSKTLAYLHGGKVLRFPAILGTGNAAPGPVTSDADSGIWIGTEGNGIFFLKNDSIINISMGEGLSSDYCYSLSFDGKYIWAVHRNSLSRIDPVSLAVRPVSGFGDVVFNYNAVAVIGPENVSFGCNRGVLTFDASVEKETAVPPVPVIISVKVNDNEIIPDQGNITLPPGKYKIRIDYIGCSLKEPQLVRYLSMLEGYDGEWSGITSDRSVTWQNLTDGRYSFLLKASGCEGITTSEPLRLGIVIRKPLWKFWWFFPSLVILSAILVFYYIKIREKRLKEEKRILEEKVRARTHELELRKSEIEQQRDEIREKNVNITSSITYARQIQKALLPPLEVLDRALPDSFIMHRPKDIVSGDFYWLSERGNKVVFTVADCTGHGVPGAFMSLLGITLLNEIVNVNGFNRSDEILSELRKRVITSLRQNRNDVTTRDGIDIALCVFDKKTKVLHFTGARSDMVIIRNGRLMVYKGDHIDVGISYNDPGNFKFNEIECRNGDTLYLFTDGYRDQFGGEFDRKFLRPHFYTTLVEVHKLPMLNQKEKLEAKLTGWMRNHEQTDDITVMGIRIS